MGNQPHCASCGKFVPKKWRDKAPKDDLICYQCVDAGVAYDYIIDEAQGG